MSKHPICPHCGENLTHNSTLYKSDYSSMPYHNRCGNCFALGAAHRNADNVLCGWRYWDDMPIPPLGGNKVEL